MSNESYEITVTKEGYYPNPYKEMVLGSELGACHKVYLVKLPPEVYSFGFTEKTITFDEKELQFEAISNLDANKKASKYDSSKTTIAEVDNTGKITPKGIGTTTIKAFVEDEEVASYELTVNKAKQGEIKFDVEADSIDYGTEEYSQVAGKTSTEDYYCSDEIEYFLNDDDNKKGIVNVGSNGEIETLQAGTVTVRAKIAGNDYYEDTTAEYILTVNPIDQTVELKFNDNSEVQTCVYGNDYPNPASGGNTAPITYSIRDVEPASNKNKIATINASDGTVHPLRFGKVGITATCPEKDGYKAQTATYTLVINRAPQDVNIESGSLKIGYLKTGKNEVSSKTDVTYSIEGSNEDADGNPIIEYGQDGIIKGLNLGTVTVVVTAKETDQYASASNKFDVTVTPANHEIKFRTELPKEFKLGEYPHYTLEAYTENDLSDEGDVSLSYQFSSTPAGIFANENVEDGSFDVTGAGTITVTATFGDSKHYAETSKDYIIKVNKGQQTVTLPQKIDLSYHLNGSNEYEITYPTESVRGAGGALSVFLPSGDQYDPDHIFSGIVINEDGKCILTIDGEAIPGDDGVVGKVFIKAAKAGDANYEPADSELCEVTIALENSVDSRTAYDVIGRKIIKDGSWYVTDVELKAYDGWLIADGWVKTDWGWMPNWKTEIVFSNEGKNSKRIYYWNGKLDFSGRAGWHDEELYIDRIAPSDPLLSSRAVGSFPTDGSPRIFAMRNSDKIVFLPSASDYGSKVVKLEYYIDEFEHESKVSIKSAEEIKLISQWENAPIDADSSTETLKVGKFEVDENKVFVVYLKATDNAGHVSYSNTGRLIFDNEKPVATVVVKGSGAGGFYTGDVTASVSVTDTLSGIKSVKYWILNPGDSENISEANKTVLYTVPAEGTEASSDGGLQHALSNLSFVINAEEHDYDNVRVCVEIVDNAGNVSYGGPNGEKYLTMDITMKPPRIDVTYDNNDCLLDENNSRGYFTKQRVATITVTGRPSTIDTAAILKGIVVTAVDSNGENVPDACNAYYDEAHSSMDASSPDNSKFVFKVEFIKDANYDFTIAYQNDAGLSCDYSQVMFRGGNERLPQDRYFTVDTGMPTAQVTVNGYTWTTLLEVLTFGLWTTETVVVTASAGDATSPVTISYFISNADALEQDLEQLVWTKYENAIEIQPNTRFAIYLKVTDYAGNTKYVCSDVFILDNQCIPDENISITLPETSIVTSDGVGVYNDDVFADIYVNDVVAPVGDMTEAEATAQSSGIQKVEYWIVNNEGDEKASKTTKRETLYSFEYERDDNEEEGVK